MTVIYPKIALDLDGVVVNFHQKLVDVYNERFPPEKGEKKLTTKAIDCDLESLGTDVSRRLIQIFNEDGYILNLEPLPDSIHIVSQFQDLNYDVTICTAPARDLNGIINPTSAAEKFHWIREHLPFWANKVIVTKHKEIVGTDMLIDDYAFNIINWCKENPNGIGYLIDQPWNKKFRHYPSNAVRGTLAGVSTFIDKFWCRERGQFAYRLEELQEGWK